LDWLDRLEWLKRLKSLNLFKYMVILLVIILVSCDILPEKPEMEDGNSSIKFIAKYIDIDTGNTSDVDIISVSLSTYDYDTPENESQINDSGIVVINDLITSVYNVKIKGNTQIPIYENSDSLTTIDVLGFKSIVPGNSESDFIDTVYCLSWSDPGLKINELYTVGSPNNFFYFFDQYIELFNSSDETKYLDGMIFCRMSYGLCCVTYIFQFPGEPLTGREYPVEPGEFVILAGDAMNHITLESNTIQLPGSIDLSQADWEFKNSKDYGDWDNPNVPNIENIEVGFTRDFLISLTSDAVLLADGSDLNYEDGIDVESVVDCVEYSSNPDHRKDMEASVDKGFGGVGLSKYSGQSLERIEPGFDSNNSTVDFEIIDAPTLWYHHE
ncbi:MAG: DUF4876 domain-containing protein, partial [Candidatus Marinimicrobia bacterium]|nr:DUF4876 domain-containing protein [Candidatus Neomarinimicrobiota bacterium]